MRIWLRLPHRSRRRRIAVTLGVVLLCVLMNELAIYATEARLAERRAAARAEGFPGTMEEILGPPIPDETNAALPLLDACRIAEKLEATIVGKIGAEFPASTVSGNAVAAQEVAKQLEYEAALSDADRRSGYRSQCAVQSKCFGPALQTLTDLRSIIRIECSRAFCLVAQGNRDEAEFHLLRMLRLERKLEGDPSLSSYDVNIAFRLATLHGLNRALRSGPLTIGIYDAVDRELALHEDGAVFFKRACAGHRAWLSEAYGTVCPWSKSWAFRAFANDDRICCWNVFSWYIRNIDAPRPLRAEAAKKTPRGFAGEALYEGEATPSGKIRHPGVVFLPVVRICAHRVDVAVAYVRCLRIVNAVQRRGGVVSSLDEVGLPLKTLVDPFTEKPLKVLWKSEGVLVYSVDADLQDDGGLLDPNYSVSKARDIGFGPVPAMK